MTMITEIRDRTLAVAPTNTLAALARYVLSYRRSGRIINELSAMDEHILKDIGLSRADVNRASVAEIGTDRIAMLKHSRARRID